MLFFFFWCFLIVGLLGGTTHPFSLSAKKWVLLNLILKGLIFYGFFLGGLTNGCSVFFFYFLGLGKLDGRVGLPTLPSFHNSQNSGL